MYLFMTLMHVRFSTALCCGIMTMSPNSMQGLNTLDAPTAECLGSDVYCNTLAEVKTIP